jgi:tetratricopeptide (TPR) repeat protein
LAAENPAAWKVVADARREDGASLNEVRTAYRRAVEATPNDRVIWERWASYEADVANELGRYKPRAVELRVRAAECDPDDLAFSGVVAGEVVALFAQSRPRYPLSKRYEWVSGLIHNLQDRFHQLPPDTLSRLGWLYYFIEQYGDAIKCVRHALEIDPNHRYSKDLERRLS